MTTSPLRWLVIAAALLAALGLAGCATSPPTRFYVLTAVAAGAGEPSPSFSGTVIGVRPVDLPEELDRAQIVTRTGPNTVHLAEFDRWSAPLRDSVTQILTENLATLLSGDQVAAWPWPAGAPMDRQVTVEITRFDGALNGRCVLQARWRVLGHRGAPPTVHGQSSLSEPAGGDYAALVAAQSRLLGALSAEIARAIRGTTRAGITAPSFVPTP